MIITKPGKYVLTENYDVWRGPWEIATIQKGTTIMVDGIGIQYHDLPVQLIGE